MDWYYYGNGNWLASSEQNDDGDRFAWMIAVNRDGLFCVDDSDSELTERKEPFASLTEAKAFCQAIENAWWGNAVSAAAAEHDPIEARA